jgi:hypothetical protein
MGNEAFGSEPTITANESLRTAGIRDLAREIEHQNKLIPAQVSESVLQNFCKAAAELMSQGFAIQLTTDQGVGIRIFPDVHVKGGNINLKRARELDPTIQTEADMVEKAGALIDKAGLKVSVRAVVQQKFTDLLDKEEYQLKRTGIVEKKFTKDDTTDGGSTDNTGGENSGGEGGDPTDPNE